MLKPYLSLSRTVHILCVGAFVNRAGAFLVPFLTLYLRESLGLGVGFATTAMGVYGFGALVAALVGGHLADKIGRKAVMLISLFGSAAILMVFGSLSTPGTILPVIGAFALISEMYRPAASAMLADVTDSAHRSHAFSLMYVAINLGFAVAAFLGGRLAEWSFQWLFWGDALTAAIYGVIIFLWISETLIGHKNDESLTKSDSATLVEAVAHIVRDRVFLLFCGGIFFLAVIYMQSVTTFPIFLYELGIGKKTYGYIMALNGVLIVLFQLPVTAWVTRYHRGWMITLSAIITGLGFALFAVSTAPWHFALALVVWTFGEIMGSPLSSAIVSDLAPKRFRARYMGVFTMSFSSSMMIGAPLGGWVLRELGGQSLWWACGLLGLVAAMAFGVLRNKLLPKSG